MPRPFFVLILAALISPSHAQQRLPVFATAADSAAFASTEQRLMDAARNPRYSARLDSLSSVLAVLRGKAIRFRTTYRASCPTRYDQRPQDLLSVTRLSIADYVGKELPDSLFLMTNLVELELVNTRIRRLPGRLNELKALKKIALLNNRPRGRIRLGKNSHVKTLVIGDDDYDFRPRSYRKFKALEALDLSRNNLTRFPALRGTRSLRRLTLADNQLTLQDLRKARPELEQLVLTSNRIETVPKVIGGFRNLKKLNMNSNQITSLPPEIGKLGKLEELSLYKNKLFVLPGEIYDLGNLRVIDLYYNQLDQLDTAIRNWSKLEVLYAANNRLYTLPDNLGALKNLRELYLHHNQLSALPESLAGLDSLRVLRVNDNHLVQFPHVLVRLQALENLDIASNQLSAIPKELLELPKLRILSLRDNPLDLTERSRLMELARNAMTTRRVTIHLEGLVEAIPGENRP